MTSHAAFSSRAANISSPLGHETTDSIDAAVCEGALERHFSIKDVAELWGLSENSVRELFREEPGVIRIQRPKCRYKRAYTTVRIPLSVLERVHRRMSLIE